MANALYRAAVRELEEVLSPRLASQSLHEGLAALGKTADTLGLPDAETVLRNRVLPRLTLSLGEARAQRTVEEVLGRLAEVAAAENRALNLRVQADALSELKDALRPFNVLFEWEEVQAARAELLRAEADHAAGRDAGERVAAVRTLLGTLEHKRREQLGAQAEALAALEAAHRDFEDFPSPKVRRLGRLLEVIRASGAAGQQAPAELERAHGLVAELRAARRNRLDDEAQELRALPEGFRTLLTLEPGLAAGLADLEAQNAQEVLLGDLLAAFRSGLEARQEALRGALLAEFREAEGDRRVDAELLARTLAALQKGLPSAADVRRLRDARRGGDLAPRRLAEFHRLEAEAEPYRAGVGLPPGPLEVFLAAARGDLEARGSLPDLAPGWALLKEVEAARTAGAAAFAARLEAARSAAATLGQLNSDEALTLRWQLQLLEAERSRVPGRQADLEAGLEQVEALVRRLYDEADAARAVASGLLAEGGALDEALGVFDLFDAAVPALPSVSVAAPAARPAAPYEPPYAAVQGWLERQLRHDFIAGLALYTENADTLVAGTLPIAAKTLGRAVRLARRRANALGSSLAQGSAASLAVETPGYTMLVFWLTRTRSLALVTHAPTWRGAARQSVEDALPELTALLGSPVPG